MQIRDGVGAGLIGIATPIAAERILSGTEASMSGLTTVMTVQGIGASLSNAIARWLTGLGGYGLACWAHGAISGLAVIALFPGRKSIAPERKNDIGGGCDQALMAPWAILFDSFHFRTNGLHDDLCDE